ncbi:MAG TPA: sigma-70 family RNA polymerase sigma factor [Oligoflexia bacterium]|nr:sigma-70 family RNA polymerase sigma factor [Oligoflexia bacterium]
MSARILLGFLVAIAGVDRAAAGPLRSSVPTCAEVILNSAYGADSSKKLLTRQDALDLVRLYKTGSERERNIVILKLRNVLFGRAMNEWRRFYGMDLEEFQSEAILGLVQGLNGFDENVSQDVLAYLIRAMDNTLRRFVQKNLKPVRFVSTKAEEILFGHYFRIVHEIRASGKEVTAESVCAQMLRYGKKNKNKNILSVNWKNKLVIENVRSWMQVINVRTNYLVNSEDQIDSDVMASTNQVAVEIAETEKQRIERESSSQFFRRMIEPMVKGLSVREKQILERRILCEEGCESTLQELANEWGGVTRERARQLDVRVRRKLDTFIKDTPAAKRLLRQFP